MGVRALGMDGAAVLPERDNKVPENSVRSRDLEAEVARLTRRLANVERLAHVGSWLWDLTTNEVVWSDELRQLFGTDPEVHDETFETFQSLIHPDDRETITTIVRRALKTASSYTIEHRLVRPNGAIRWVQARGDVEVDEDGMVVVMHGISVDITERRNLDLELRRFVSDAAHELRTPVTTVTYAIGMLASDDLPDDQRKVVTAALARNGERLKRLTETLLDLSTIEADASTALVEQVDLADVVERAIESLPLHATQRVAIDVGIPAGLRVQAAADDLERVFVNLVANAIQHGGSQLSVIATTADDDRVVVEVRDDGPGVDPEVAENLFVPFARGRRAGLGGSGLGLSISRRLLERFGGSIDHQPEDDGASFVVRLEPAS